MAANFNGTYRDLDITAVITLSNGKQLAVEAPEIYSYRQDASAASSGLPIGMAMSTNYTLTLVKTACPYGVVELDGAEVRVRMGSKATNGYEYVDAGLWYVTAASAPESGSTLTLNGSDALNLYFDSKLEDNASAYPRTLSSLLDLVCTLAGVPLAIKDFVNGSTAIAKLPRWPENTSLRDIVGYIAACAGGFAQIDPSGRLEVVTNGRGQVWPIAPDQYINYTPTGGTRFAFNCLRVTMVADSEDAEIPEPVRFAVDANIADNSTNCIEISGNPLYTDAIAAKVRDTLKGLSYSGATLNWLGDPRVACGTQIDITTLDGSTERLLVTNKQLTFDGGLSMSCASVMPTAHQPSAHYSSAGQLFTDNGQLPVNRIENFGGGVVQSVLGKFDRIIAGSIETDEFFARMGKVVFLQVNQFEAGSIDAEIIKARSITAGQIKTGTITADSGVIDNGAIGTAQIADGSITSAKVVSLNADVINAGTLSVERLIFVGENGIIYKLNAEASGLSVTELQKDEYQNHINGTVIVARSITAAQIAAQTITGNEILAGSITAKEINVSDLFASQATIDALNTMNISNNKYLKLMVSESVDSVQVGGKNYIMGTAGEYVAESDGSERRWLFPWACKDATTARGLYGQTVTVSFDYDQDIQSGGVGMHFGRNWLGVKDFTAGQATAQRFEGVIDLPALESPGDDEDNVILYLDGTWNGRVTFRNMKLELGNKATDWTPNPEEFRAGSSILMNKDEVNISTPKFNVNIVSEDGETNMLSIDEEGANMPRLTAGNVAARYDGPSTLYVDPNATAAQIEAGNYCRSLADALSRIHQRCLDKEVFIKLAPGMTEYGTLTLTSVTGGCWIYINGDPSNPAKLVGRLNLYFNLSPIKIEHLNIDTTSVGLNMEGCSTVQYWHGIITGPGVSVGGTSCVAVAHNSHVYVSNSELYDCECALYSVTGSAINSSENKGNCRVRANGAIVYAHWAQPCDSTTWVADEWAGKVFTANVSVDQGTKPTPVPAPTSASVTANLTDSWYASSKAWLNSDNYMRQGYTSNNGEWSGCMWFDTSAFSGKTIQSAALTIKRDDGYGRAGAVTLKLWGTTATTNSGNPNTGAVSYGALGTIENGETKTFTLPLTAAQALASGTIKGFMLRSDDGGVMSGRTYSYNYCRISTMPVLAVTFT